MRSKDLNQAIYWYAEQYLRSSTVTGQKIIFYGSDEAKFKNELTQETFVELLCGFEADDESDDLQIEGVKMKELCGTYRGSLDCHPDPRGLG